MKTVQLSTALFLCTCVATAVNAQTNYNSYPSRIVGQAVLQQQGLLTAIAPNLVEGRELDDPQWVAVDNSTSPPIVYVADTVNNRVLVWKNAAGFSNGAFADQVIGQRDFYSTSNEGPAAGSSSLLSTGLTAPVAVMVDGSGNLYVADAGNNRILRFPNPTKQTGSLLNVDLIIGQIDSSGGSSNQGLSAPTSQTLSLVSGGSPIRSGLAFDSSGNLWVSDAGNNRVLRFPTSSLAANTSTPTADLVLGQNTFTSNAIPSGVNSQSKNFLAGPAGLAFDPSGRLFVTDDANRVVVYVPPFSSGMYSSRILGVTPATAANPNPAAVSATSLGASNNPPQGVFFIGSNPYVVDTGNNRILEYQSFDQWAAESTSFSPAAIAVVGQNDYSSSQVNAGLTQPNGSTLNHPVGAVFAPGIGVFVADSGNNRVLVLPGQSASAGLGIATRVLGQNDVNHNAVNLIEGREFFFYQSGVGLGGAVVIDSTSTPPHLYVSDTVNNRILGFNDYRTVHAGATADIVIGQPDFFTNEANYPSNSTTKISATGLNTPEGIAVDSSGNLYVADLGNARVLRYPQPFNSANSAQTPNLVLGQATFTQKVTDASASTMRSPYSLAFTHEGSLVVADACNSTTTNCSFNRVVLFLKSSGSDFTNGQAASNAIGQPDFGPPTSTSLAQPHGVAVDNADRLYVADTYNNRILVYQNIQQAAFDASPDFSISTGTGSDTLNNPLSVAINPSSGEIWVADTNNNRLLRYPAFNGLVNSVAANATLSVPIPLFVTLDPFGNPVDAEGLNRVAFYYPQLNYTQSGNAANYFLRFSPGMLATIKSYSSAPFGTQTAGASTVPLPTTLGDTEVLVAGKAAPLLYVSPGQINFQIPYETQASSLGQEIQVLRASTGQVVGSFLFRIDPASPGLFTANSTGQGQISALNQDGSVNSSTKPAKAGSYVSLFGTGVGNVAGAPADGNVAKGILRTSVEPGVYINASAIPASGVQYSGLAPGLVGVWQINVQVPTNVPTGNVSVVVVFAGVNSNLDQYGNRVQTTIATQAQ